MFGSHVKSGHLTASRDIREATVTPPGGVRGSPGTSPTPHGPALLIANAAWKSYWYHTGSAHSTTRYDAALEIEAILRVEYRCGAGPPYYEVHWKGYSLETTETTEAV